MLYPSLCLESLGLIESWFSTELFLKTLKHLQLALKTSLNKINIAIKCGEHLPLLKCPSLLRGLSEVSLLWKKLLLIFQFLNGFSI